MKVTVVVFKILCGWSKNIRIFVHIAESIKSVQKKQPEQWDWIS